MSGSSSVKFWYERDHLIEWRKIKNYTLLTDKVFDEQAVVRHNVFGGKLQLFNLSNNELKVIPELSTDIMPDIDWTPKVPGVKYKKMKVDFFSRIQSGVIIQKNKKAELYVSTYINDQKEKLEPKHRIYKIDLHKLDTWVYCKFMQKPIEYLYSVPEIDSCEPITLHNFGEQDLFLSTPGIFMSYRLKTGDAFISEVPDDHTFIQAVTEVKDKIYFTSGTGNLLELDNQTKEFREIVLQDVSKQSESHLYESDHHRVTLNTQEINNLQVYHNRYILLNYLICKKKFQYNYESYYEMKWRFIIYDTKLDEVDTSRFYRMWQDKKEMTCYGLWIEDSYLFYEEVPATECYTFIYDIREIVGNYRTVESWVVVKSLMNKERLGERLALGDEFDIIVNVLNLNMDLFKYVINFLLIPKAKKGIFLGDHLDETLGNPKSQFFHVEY